MAVRVAIDQDQDSRGLYKVPARGAVCDDRRAGVLPGSGDARVAISPADWGVEGMNT